MPVFDSILPRFLTQSESILGFILPVDAFRRKAVYINYKLYQQLRIAHKSELLKISVRRVSAQFEMYMFPVAAKRTAQAGIEQSRAPGLFQALAPPQAVLPLTAIPVCAFFALGGGDIYSRAALMPTRPTGRDVFERRTPAKQALWG